MLLFTWYCKEQSAKTWMIAVVKWKQTFQIFFNTEWFFTTITFEQFNKSMSLHVFCQSRWSRETFPTLCTLKVLLTWGKYLSYYFKQKGWGRGGGKLSIRGIKLLITVSFENAITSFWSLQNHFRMIIFLFMSSLIFDLNAISTTDVFF